MKKIILLMLFVLTAVVTEAQNVFSVDDGNGHYNIPIGAEIRVNADNGFTLSLDKKDYQFGLNAKITPAEGKTKLPICLKNNTWQLGLSSITSASAGIFSRNDNAFTWKDDYVCDGSYGLSGTVIDTVRNVSMVSSWHKYYGKTVDMIFLKVATGETGYYSIPSDTLCDYKQTTHVGKVAVIIISYATDAETGEVANNAVGVRHWTSQLRNYTGISGKTYQSSGYVMYFDDLETAKDVALNTDNFSRSSDSYGLSAPTWNYLTAGSSLKEEYISNSDVLKPFKIDIRTNISPAKPTQKNLNDSVAWRFDSPDPENAIVNYHYTATDSTAKFQYPELKSGLNDKPEPYSLNENNTWLGATCLYLVPSNGYLFSKYRKFDGYIHVTMADGAEYRKHFSINKTGIINADEEWEQTKEHTVSVTTNLKNEDNGKPQYFNLKFMALHMGSGNGLEKDVLTYDEAHAFEADPENNVTTPFVPRLWTYVPYTCTQITPKHIMHRCNYSFCCENAEYLGEEMQQKGVVLKLNDDVKGTYWENNYRYWMFTDDEGHIIAYTLHNTGAMSALEWFE